MLTIARSKRFEGEYRKFVKHSSKRAESIIKAVNLFIQDSKRPSLHIEKLKGNNVWSMRIDRGNRIFFIWVNTSTVLFIDVGPHDKYRSY